jgi:DUF4097 and DUF4098 domain-containing protein YvlB
MRKHTLTTAIGAGLTMSITLAAAAAMAGENRNESRLDIAPDGTVNIVNSSGVVNIHSGGGRQVVVVSLTRSNKIEVDQNVTPDKKRVEILTHTVAAGQKPSEDEARVDLDVAVPEGVSVTVSSATAPITVDGLSGNVISLASDTGQIVVRNISKAHVHVRSVTAPVSLSDIVKGHIEITSAGGAVQITRVSGPLVSVGTTNGNITYQGDCSGGGTYTLATHSGAIDVTLPETASVDLSARSITGSVQNDFPLQEKTHSSFVPKPGSSFTGTSLSGSSSVELQSFSGRIRVKKQ